MVCKVPASGLDLDHGCLRLRRRFGLALLEVDCETLESTDVFRVELFPTTDDLSVPSEEIELTASPRGKEGELGMACRDVRRRKEEPRRTTVALVEVPKFSNLSRLARAFGDKPLPLCKGIGVIPPTPWLTYFLSAFGDEERL